MTANGAARRYLMEVVIPHKGDECLIWPYKRTRQGYGHIKHLGEMCGVHRIVCEAVNGEAPSTKLVAAHNCNNGHLGCVNPGHLSWQTYSQNNEHWIKLLDADVPTVRDLAKIMPQAEVAEQFGVSQALVSAVVNKVGRFSTIGVD